MTVQRNEVQVFLLGSPMTREGQQDRPFTSFKQAVLLTLLALKAPWSSREALCALLWPDSDPDAARKNLRNALWALHRQHEVDIDDQHGHLSLSEKVWVDVRHIALPGSLSLEQRLDAALALRGQLLDTRWPELEPEVEQFLLDERSTLQQQQVQQLRELTQECQQANQWQEVQRLTTLGLQMDPLDELLQTALLQSYLYLGQRAEGLRQLARLRLILQQEVGSEPAEQWRMLEEQLQRLPVSAVAETPKRPVSQVPLALRSEMVRSTVLQKLAAEENATLILVVAPAGFGKSTLLAQFARSTTKTAIWLSLGLEALDVYGLMSNVKSALQQHLPELTFVHWQAADAPPEAQARALARDLNAWPQPVELLMDGAEVLDVDASRWLEQLCLSLSAPHRVLVGARNLPHLRLSRLAAQEAVVMIDAAQLAFTEDESEAYLLARGYAKDRRAAHQELEGWPAGLALVAAGASMHVSPQDMIRELIEDMPAPLRECLPQLAVLPEWSEEAALALGLQLPEAWMTQLRQLGLPITPLQQRVLRPHSLLKSYLLEQLERQPQLCRRLHMAASERALSTERPLEAFDHLLRAGEHERAAQLLTSLGRNLQRRGQYRLLRHLIEQLPSQTLDAEFRALYGLALIELGDLQEARRQLEGLENAAPHGYALLAQVRLAAREGDAQRMLNLTEHFSLEGEWVRSALQRARIIALLTLGRHDEAAPLAEQAVKDTKYSSTLEQAQALTMASMAQIEGRRWDEAYASTVRALKLYEQIEQPVLALPQYNCLAELQLRQVHLEEAMKTVERGLTIARQEEHPMEVFLLDTQGKIALWLSKPAQAAGILEQALLKGRQLNHTGFQVKLLLVLSEAHIRFDLEKARQLLQEARVEIDPSDQAQWGAWHFTAGLLAFAAGQDPRPSFTQVEGSYDDLHPARAALLLAESLRREGRLKKRHLLDLRDLIGESGLSLKQVVTLDSHQIQGLFTHELWQSVFGFQHGSVASVEEDKGTPQLKLMTLGSLRLMVNGEPLKLSLKKSVELLTYLVLNGPSTRETLLEALWGAETQQVIEYFKVALKRLRSDLQKHPALSELPILYQEGYYQVSPKIEILTDLHTLNPEALKAALKAHPAAGFPEFLDQVTQEWAWPWRETGRERLQHALDEGIQTAATPQERLEWLKHALKFDPLNTATVSQIAQQLVSLQGKDKAMSFLKTHCQLVEREYDIALPLDELRSLCG